MADTDKAEPSGAELLPVRHWINEARRHELEAYRQTRAAATWEAEHWSNEVSRLRNDIDAWCARADLLRAQRYEYAHFAEFCSEFKDGLGKEAERIYALTKGQQRCLDEAKAKQCAAVGRYARADVKVVELGGDKGEDDPVLKGVDIGSLLEDVEEFERNLQEAA